MESNRENNTASGLGIELLVFFEVTLYMTLKHCLRLAARFQPSAHLIPHRNR